MNKPSLSKPIDTYVAEQEEIIRHWSAQLHQSVDAPTPVPNGLGRSDMLHASSLTLVSCARAWEVFRSEWHQRAVAADATVFKLDLQRRLLANLSTSELGKSLAAAGIQATISLGKHPTLPVVATLLDRAEQNITFRGRVDAEKRAEKELDPHLAAKVRSLDHDDWLLINLLVTTRNAISHASPASIEKMNGAMSEMGGAKDPQLRQLARNQYKVSRSGIGAYLYTYVKTAIGYDNTRVVLICLRMKDMANKFR